MKQKDNSSAVPQGTSLTKLGLECGVMPRLLDTFLDRRTLTHDAVIKSLTAKLKANKTL
jgi:hypothetical protein